jgi:uncharacterized glyoxalase superfamily protein PhnB
MLEPMNNFTPRAQMTLALARKEADRLHHHWVGTEHMLLGLIELGQGPAVRVLQKMGLDLETVRLAVIREVGQGPADNPKASMPFTPAVKRSLALAGKEAKELNHSYVGTEHLLLGLLREGSDVAARVLQSLGVDLERTRVEILRELKLPAAAEAGPRTAPLLPFVQPYVFFDGRCEEALEFYRRALGAEIVSLLRFKDGPEPGMTPPGSGDKILHACFRIGASTLFASDGRCLGHPSFQGFSLSIVVSTQADAERLFAALADGGEIRMPLTKTFFSPHFGMVADRFGVAWMVYVGPT